MAGWWQAGAPALTLARERREAAVCVIIFRIHVATTEGRRAEICDQRKFKYGQIQKES
jgi:hypothetical protein